MSKIEVNEIDKQNGSTVTIGGSGTNVVLGTSGQTVSLGTGASQSGFGRSGSVNWQTTPKTATFTAADGEGYFINSGSAITANLPAGSAGAIVAFADYARNFNTHNFTISPNGSEKIGGEADDVTLNVNGQALTLVYVDSTKGWINVQNAEDTEIGQAFINATGGTITNTPTCRIHTFNSPGTFAVSSISSCAANNQVSHIVVGGGGGGGSYHGGGAGAGGFRENKAPTTPYTASPLDGQPSAPNRVTVTATSFPITVGAGGAGNSSPPNGNGSSGTVSTFSTISSAGGGGGSSNPYNGLSGGSGGGGNSCNSPSSVGAGNTPPVSPPQGNPGGASGYGTPHYGMGGGGGAGSPGGGGNTTTAGNGGAGVSTEITGSAVTYAGGGGGSTYQGGTAGTGGSGGGGNGAVGGPSPNQSNAVAGTANTGGGGGGGERDIPAPAGGNGGSGVVIIRYKIA